MTRGEVVRDYGGVSADDRREARRLKLIAAGRVAWGRSGVSDVTVRGVCKSSGLAYRYFYEHFPNRDALIVAVADQIRDEMIALLVESSEATGGPIDQRLSAALHSFLTAIDAEPTIFRIMTTDVSTVVGLENRQSETLDFVADVMVAYVSDHPDLPKADIPLAPRTARFISGGVNRLIESWLTERDTDMGTLVDACVRLSMAAASVHNLSTPPSSTPHTP